MAFEAGNIVEVKGYSGVAFYLDQREQIQVIPDIWLDDDFDIEVTLDDVETIDGSQWECHMVGDDRKFFFDEDELTLLDEGDYCSSCGQIGCSHG